MFKLYRYCKLNFLIGNDHLMYSQTNLQSSIGDINYTSAKAILSILSSKSAFCSKKHLEIDTLCQEDMDRTSTYSSVIDVLKSLSKSSFLFVALKEFEKNDMMSQKKALVSISRSCVNYFKPNVLDRSDNKPILQKAFLFGKLEGSEHQIKVNLVINCFQKRFQNPLLGNVAVFQGLYLKFLYRSF